ncbi:MAG: hypothetical protein H6741_32560 [Alphaproteobacteria bacterium]|nr:hypothetical protein [Alphaproteobacteria bacterium]MCB9797448.1 hypothetical protein [Alphaproteobacteria bacterium]
MTTPHDHLIKAVYGDPKHAAEALREELPEAAQRWQAPQDLAELAARLILEVWPNPQTEHRLKQIALEVLGPAAKETIMTAADRLRAEGRLQGRREGRREGLEEGRRDEARRLLLRVLQVKLGPLPPWARAHVEAAELEDLEQWMEGIFAAESLKALLLP